MGLVCCWSPKKSSNPLKSTPVESIKALEVQASKDELKVNKEDSIAVEDDLNTKWEMTPSANNMTTIDQPPGT